jgi:hypothetical protein
MLHDNPRRPAASSRPELISRQRLYLQGEYSVVVREVPGISSGSMRPVNSAGEGAEAEPGAPQ